jgi:hypothetical protein
MQRHWGYAMEGVRRQPYARSSSRPGDIVVVQEELARQPIFVLRFGSVRLG